MKFDLGTIIAELHDSEINGGVTWFYDGCWDVTLGDPLNGIMARGHELTIDPRPTGCARRRSSSIRTVCSRRSGGIFGRSARRSRGSFERQAP